MAVTANKIELMQIADAVAREKSIDRMIVIEAMEDALSRAARSRYGAETNVRAEIDPQTGETRLWRLMEVVETVENDSAEIALVDAQRQNPEAELGDFLSDPLPPVDFGRVAALAAKQTITQKVRDAERENQYEEFKDRQGEIISGLIKRIEYGHVIVDLGRAEAVIRRDQQIPREPLRQGDRVRAYVADVRREPRGPQIFLSRTHPQFVARLFEQEVPEVYDGVIEIKAVARDPGSRAKIGVYSNDSSIDPVGACVGMRGSRVQAVVSEIAGERIDIVPWSEDTATFIVNALAPAEVAKVVLDEEMERVEVVVAEDQLSLAIGRRGQNVRLASQLSGYEIDLMTEEEEAKKRQKEYAERSALFMEVLDVDEMIANLLVAEGFARVEEIAYVDLDEIAMIEGFDDETAQELQARAQEWLENERQALDAKRREMGVEDDLLTIEGLDLKMVVALAEEGVKTVEDLAGCVTDDLTGWTERVEGEKKHYEGMLEKYRVRPETAEAMIAEARARVGWDVEEEPAEA
ncbi:transcription termination factor NusA [Parvularcula dongshanensis]|uniref:Transcription termination/antitermination protein NusA n=1 Tax=Parvularcula dongshanensis TaxID=1173995 RepID=A0A840I182_9PROT|nr:transcription termination factor NusA [Parvularcula dongshanensis]MBB4657994.1 N utilization substance protein A [Parvularcula dongshanensis]